MRDKVTKDIISLNFNNILLELPTGFGKTLLALKKAMSLKSKNILIVVPRLVLIQSWKDEISKWGFRINPVFTTYVSLPKHASNWDLVIYDEAHHLSERCRESLNSFNIKNNLLLSATVKSSVKDALKRVFRDLYCYKVSTKEAIEEEVLPEPLVVLLPMVLDDKVINKQLEYNPKGKTTITTDYPNRWNYIKNKNLRVIVNCTEKEYIQDLNSKIEWYKNKFFRTNNIAIKNRWLQQCTQRLKYLSEFKNNTILSLLQLLGETRTLVFCNNIEQTIEFGNNCINSKNNNSANILDSFNSGKITRIQSVNMLNEGVNLNNCKVGLFASLNSSETMVIQKIGRVLRHKNPILIIPYFKETREEELVNKMLEGFSINNIFILNNPTEILTIL